ncbi:zinc transporter ZntB [Pacificimonas sp. WHA3]|uniref:Zinc transporter ZntB n=1 Tax=Pacificimonas pallii TaxID=2827236 RepID=A0ABS6SFW1_9SPHN|nr:zinc transporter ZntB [Pacificimonas pallii]MBV7256742.1 zinc transporter ZntB [Pacificimonas pallii]
MIALEVPELAAVAEEDGLLFAVRLNREGGGTLLHWKDVLTWTPADGPLWLHVDASSRRVREWLDHDSGLTPITIEALLDPRPRPRVFQGKNGYVTILRGINLNEGADPEDMVSLRLWSDGVRLISLRQEYLKTPRFVLDDVLRAGAGPVDAPALYERMISKLIDFLGVAIEEYETRIEDIEQRIDKGDIDALRSDVSELRQNLVSMRRYMAPQVGALQRLTALPPEWLAPHEALLLRESADQFERYLEDLDEFRERAIVAKDDIVNRQSERMNQTMYVLSIVAAIFLPLGFLTGLFGINVGGMPGVDDDMGFWIVTISMGLIIAAELWIFRRLGWL